MQYYRKAVLICSRKVYGFHCFQRCWPSLHSKQVQDHVACVELRTFTKISFQFCWTCRHTHRSRRSTRIAYSLVGDVTRIQRQRWRKDVEWRQTVGWRSRDERQTRPTSMLTPAWSRCCTERKGRISSALYPEFCRRVAGCSGRGRSRRLHDDIADVCSPSPRRNIWQLCWWFWQPDIHVSK